MLRGIAAPAGVPSTLRDGVTLGHPVRQGRVLLVDDDAGVRELLADVLDAAGYTVTRAESGEEALAVLRTGRAFDVLVSDYAMPGITGGELMEKVRRMRPDLPALVVIGYAEGAQLGQVPAGVDVVRKPFRADWLAQRVAELISASRAEEG